MASPIETLGGVRLDPDGSVTRMGLVALSTDLTFERDAARVLPHDGLALHVARIAFQNPTTPANLRAMLPDLSETAALLVPGVDLAAICFGCTSAAITLGDAAIDDAVARARPGVPVITPARAALKGFAALGIQRIVLLAPYLRETTRPVAEYFSAAGLEVVRACCLDMADDRDIARLSADTIISAALAADTPEAEAMFISCTSMPTLGLIAEIERRLGKPLLTSNQACLWQMLGIAGRPMPEGYGRLADVHRAMAGAA
ncbi:maleate isomerase [Palleronia marisminoris]|uniref:Maleate isomerase n=1 Tax=Palleronia marisminoris TaxID=315423 RepID=A0A1Y5RMC7_9RHOB|nr:aspartate/glutamate racemase family protein [Palleronia marisminoris]SFG27692.1 maleate isomerase [Palleronia marisminoris]SLN20840.1 Maleate isomerase [Palleronia marisminoris]